MACLIKPPLGSRKGCVTFTTPERDFLMRKDAAALAAVASLKSRYIVGLHHNWHDLDFIYDPIFSFSMYAGEESLKERGGKTFPHLALDASNFAPDSFFSARNSQPFWDVINVTRECYFKGHEEFLDAIRAIYDQGKALRVLHLCPVPRAKPDEDPIPKIRRLHETMFSREERRIFTLMTMDWDHPFPLDLETLAFFYRSSRVFVHTSPEERSSRIAAYAWANGMPVVGADNLASILPRELRVAPFYFGYKRREDIAGAIVDAVESRPDSADWTPVKEQFHSQSSALRLSEFLDRLAGTMGVDLSPTPINSGHMDIRLGRHHLPSLGDSPNLMNHTIIEFCDALRSMPDDVLAAASRSEYPEEALFPQPKVNLSIRAETKKEPDAARSSIAKSATPSLRQRFRTALRSGFHFPLTKYRIVIDILRDAR